MVKSSPSHRHKTSRQTVDDGDDEGIPSIRPPSRRKGKDTLSPPSSPTKAVKSSSPVPKRSKVQNNTKDSGEILNEEKEHSDMTKAKKHTQKHKNEDDTEQTAKKKTTKNKAKEIAASPTQRKKQRVGHTRPEEGTDQSSLCHHCRWQSAPPRPTCWCHR